MILTTSAFCLATFYFFHGDLIEMLLHSLLLSFQRARSSLKRIDRDDDTDTCSTSSTLSSSSTASSWQWSTSRRQHRSGRKVRFSTVCVQEFHPVLDNVKSTAHGKQIIVHLDDWEFQRWQDQVSRTHKTKRRIPRRRFTDELASHVKAVNKQNEPSIEKKHLSARKMIQRKGILSHTIRRKLMRSKFSR